MDDVRHLVLQCPRWQPLRNEVLHSISHIPDGSRKALLEFHCDLVVGKCANDFSVQQMSTIWSIAARSVAKMHNSSVKEDIG